MPNTEVKLLYAESSWWVTACEGRKLPRFSETERSVFFDEKVWLIFTERFTKTGEIGKLDLVMESWQSGNVASRLRFVGAAMRTEVRSLRSPSVRSQGGCLGFFFASGVVEKFKKAGPEAFTPRETMR